MFVSGMGDPIWTRTGLPPPVFAAGNIRLYEGICQGVLTGDRCVANLGVCWKLLKE